MRSGGGFGARVARSCGMGQNPYEAPRASEPQKKPSVFRVVSNIALGIVLGLHTSTLPAYASTAAQPLTHAPNSRRHLLSGSRRRRHPVTPTGQFSANRSAAANKVLCHRLTFFCIDDYIHASTRVGSSITNCVPRNSDTFPVRPCNWPHAIRRPGPTFPESVLRQWPASCSSPKSPLTPNSPNA